MRTGFLPVVLSIALTACSESPSVDGGGSTEDFGESADDSVAEAINDESRDFTSSTYGSLSYSSSDDEEFDEDAAREQAEDDLSSEGYDYSYGCTEDCSGHDAGWGYQAQQGYGSYPSGNSRSFEEGRMAFDEAVDERVEEARDDWESEHDE